MRALALSALVSLAAVPTLPQDVAQTLELRREAIEDQKRIVVAGSLPLTDKQADEFWPLYDRFQKELKELNDRTDRLIASYTAEYAGLSDARARELVDELLSIHEDRAKLMRKWARRMADVLPPRLLLRYFQLEHRFHTLVSADLTRQVPLAP